MIDCSNNIKVKSVEILNVHLDVEPVPFNKGFYSVDMTFFFNVKLQVYSAACSVPTVVNGLSHFTKKVILYGSEGNIRVFCSDETCNRDLRSSMPIACVSVVDPIALAVRSCPCCNCCCHVEVPQEVCCHYKGQFCCEHAEKCVYVTIGMFTIVQLCRDVQMLIPAYDFCIPEKECTISSADPCEVFKSIKFPTSDFFPPREPDCNCGCQN